MQAGCPSAPASHHFDSRTKSSIIKFIPASSPPSTGRTTPEMYVIAPDGTLIYEGAIDDHPTTDQKDIAGAKNYVDAALSDAMASKPIADAATRPYGCSVKYKKF